MSLDDNNEIPGYLNKKIYSDIDIERNLVKKEEPKKGPTILDLKLEEIIENLVGVVANFQKDYIYKLYEVDLEFKLDNKDNNFYSNLKKYLLAFMLYMGDKDNMLYIGILLIIISIILYFFNITILHHDQLPGNRS